MQEIMMKLVQQITDQKSYLDCVEKRLESARQFLREEFTEENCRRCEELSTKVGNEQLRLRHLRDALVSVYKAVGYPESEVNDYMFEPEKF